MEKIKARFDVSRVENSGLQKETLSVTSDSHLHLIHKAEPRSLDSNPKPSWAVSLQALLPSHQRFFGLEKGTDLTSEKHLKPTDEEQTTSEPHTLL
ncbi:hypothetical protein DSO57_1020944 [Entomophthora muscae]|uniref:Uncharacterized protein n=1 Tax=Entomophthora muscae TaxID=34485 RepID=A0ACC2U1Y2_9FUNG|nr:hypothetical protein DSO57_1020944 [Entomophthora muscae]